MRTELIVIVAIIFLCSWCVYVLVKMNSSLGTPNQASANANQSTVSTSDYKYEASRPAVHHVQTNPPYRINSNHQQQQQPSIYKNLPFYPPPKGFNSTSSLNYDYDDYTDQQSAPKPANNHFIQLVPSNMTHRQIVGQPAVMLSPAYGPPVPPPLAASNEDIDVTRPRVDPNQYHQVYQDGKVGQLDHNKQRQQQQQQAVSSGSRSRPVEQEDPADSDDYTGEELSASSPHIGRLYKENTNATLNQENEQGDSTDPDDDSGNNDEGVEVDERSGSSSYDENENEAHNNGRKSVQPGEMAQIEHEIPEAADADIPDNLAQSTRPSVNSLNPSKAGSDEEYYEDDQDPATTNGPDLIDDYTEDHPNNNKNNDNNGNNNGKDTHEHKMKESVVSQRWNDDGDDSGPNTDNGRQVSKQVASKENTKTKTKTKASKPKRDSSEDETVKFLDLDEMGIPFGSKRFKRDTYDDTNYVNMSVPITVSSYLSADVSANPQNNNNDSNNLDNLDIDRASTMDQKAYPYAINQSQLFKVDLPKFYGPPEHLGQAPAMSIGATLGPYQSTQISIIPNSMGHQAEVVKKRKRKKRQKRKEHLNSRPYPIEMTPVANHEASVQPEYMVVEKDRITEPSHHYKKKAKHNGHKFKKHHEKSKHSKILKKQKKKMSKSYKKGAERKKKHKMHSDKYKKEKGFKGLKKGNKHHRGHGVQGGKKGMKFYKDKGYKKKGFKNTYHKEEFGDRKTYFDEFRDKDYKKKWKKFEDKHKYNQVKKWVGKDVKKMKKLKDNGQKHKISGKAKWKKKHSSNHKKAQHYQGEGSKKKKKSYSKKI